MSTNEIQSAARQTYALKKEGTLTGSSHNLVYQLGKKSITALAWRESELLFLERYEFADSFGADSSSILKQFVEKKDHLRPDKARETSLVMATEKFFLMPKSEYQPGRGKELFDLMYFRDDSEELQKEELNILEALNIYSLPAGFREIVKKELGIARIRHLATPFVVGLTHQFNSYEGVISYAHLEEGSLFLACLNDGRLSFCNHFQINAVEDLVYYLIGASEHTGMDPKNDKLVMSGRIDREGELFELTGNYFRNISLIPAPTGMSYPKEGGKKDLHQFYPLLSSAI